MKSVKTRLFLSRRGDVLAFLGRELAGKSSQMRLTRLCAHDNHATPPSVAQLDCRHAYYSSTETAAAASRGATGLLCFFETAPPNVGRLNRRRGAN